MPNAANLAQWAHALRREASIINRLFYKQGFAGKRKVKGERNGILYELRNKIR
jgi:hypothetical protein